MAGHQPARFVAVAAHPLNKLKTAIRGIEGPAGVFVSELPLLGKSLLKEGRIGQRRWCVNDIYILSHSPDHWILSKFLKKVLFNAFYESIDKTIYCLK